MKVINPKLMWEFLLDVYGWSSHVMTSHGWMFLAGRQPFGCRSVKVTSKTQGEPGGDSQHPKWFSNSRNHWKMLGSSWFVFWKYVDDGYSMNSCIHRKPNDPMLIGKGLLLEGWPLKTKDNRFRYILLRTWVDESLVYPWHIPFLGIPLRPNWHQVKAIRLCLAPLYHMMGASLS